MTDERLGPSATRQDIRKWITEHPEGVSILLSDLDDVAKKRGWSDLVDHSRRITSGLKTLGVVRIEGTTARPISPIKP